MYMVTISELGEEGNGSLSVVYSATNEKSYEHFRASDVDVINNTYLIRLSPGTGRYLQVQVVVSTVMATHVSMSLNQRHTVFLSPVLRSVNVSSGNVNARIITITGDHFGQSVDWKCFSDQVSQKIEAFIGRVKMKSNGNRLQFSNLNCRIIRVIAVNGTNNFTI